MGRIINLIVQKFVPPAKKTFWVDLRRKNGSWVSLQVPPKQSSFKFNSLVYYLKGRPDIEDSTNQRRYIFFEGIPYPLKFDDKHESLLKINKDSGNFSLALAEADEEGYQRALLLKKKNPLNSEAITMWVSIGTFILVILVGWFLFGQNDQIINAIGGA